MEFLGPEVWSCTVMRTVTHTCICVHVRMYVYVGFPCGSAGKESTCNAGDLGSIPGLGRSPGEGKGYPLQYSGLENSMDCIVQGVTKSQTQLSDFHFHFFFPLFWSRLREVVSYPTSTESLLSLPHLPPSGLSEVRSPWVMAVIPQI